MVIEDVQNEGSRELYGYREHVYSVRYIWNFRIALLVTSIPWVTSARSALWLRQTRRANATSGGMRCVSSTNGAWIGDSSGASAALMIPTVHIAYGVVRRDVSTADSDVDQRGSIVHFNARVVEPAFAATRVFRLHESAGGNNVVRRKEFVHRELLNKLRPACVVQ